jgi:hypothetical protein
MSISKTANTATLGLHVYMGGVIFQQLVIACFFMLTVAFQRKLKYDVNDRSSRRGAEILLLVLRGSLALITVRSFSLLPIKVPNCFITQLSSFRSSGDSVAADVANLVPHYLPNRPILRPFRQLAEHIYQPPRVLHIRLRCSADVSFVVVDEYLASGENIG